MKKNVCMIVYNDYPLDTRVRREAEALVASGAYKVRILALNSGGTSRSYMLNGVSVFESAQRKYYKRSFRRYLLSYLRFLLSSSIRCAKLFLAGEAEIVHVHNMPNFLVFASLIPRLFGSNVILDVHDTVPETFATKFGRSGLFLFKVLCLEEYLACAFAQKVLCVNHVQCEVMLKRGVRKEKLSIILNVPDDRLFDIKNSNGTGRADDGFFKIIYHGTMSKRLGIDLIIRAVAKLTSQIKGLQLYLWGRGDDLESFVNLVEQLKVQDKIQFNRSHLPIEKLLPEIRQMDLGIIGNRFNMATELMLPVKMLEYVALGIPVVVPKLKGIRHYFTGEMVSFYDPENVDSMAEAVLRLYNDKGERKAQAEKAMAFLRMYGWESHKYDLINLYKSL